MRGTVEMTEKQEIINIRCDELQERVKRFARARYRLVQIGCTRLDQFQLDYSFDKGCRFVTLRVHIRADNPSVPSVSDAYWTAFTYENEINDLFGIEFENLNINYGGRFYRITVKTPFNIAPPRDGKGHE